MKKFITFLLFLPLFVCCKAGSDYGDAVIGIAWLDNVDFKFHTDVKTTLDDLGIKNVLLKEVIHNSLQYKDGMLFSEQVDENGILKAECAEIVKSGKFAETNVAEVMKDVSAVIFVGGEDVSPTLYANPVPWHNILQERDYNATRDVSDFLLMRYCLDNDIHILGICRGTISSLNRLPVRILSFLL